MKRVGQTRNAHKILVSGSERKKLFLRIILKKKFIRLEKNIL